MEKFIYTLIMIMGLSTTVALADDKVVETVDAVPVTLNYMPVELENLPANIQEVLALSFPCSVVTSVEVKLVAETVIYKVILSDPENMETVVYITDKGKILE